MKKVCRFFTIISLSLLVCFSSACTKGGGSDDGGSSGGGSTNNGTEFVTECGVVFEGKMQNPVLREDGRQVTVSQALGANLVEINDSELVKLQGVAGGAVNSAVTAAVGGTYFFYPADDTCSVSLGAAGNATIGTLIAADSTSLNESSVAAGALPDQNDACNGSFVGSCYGSIYETYLDEQGNEDEDEVDESMVGNDSFDLWKPVSDSDGRVVFLTAICASRIVVETANGATEELRLIGPGNGRCESGRGSKAGCGYGNNVKVKIYIGDNLIRTRNIDVGCNRTEFR